MNLSFYLPSRWMHWESTDTDAIVSYLNTSSRKQHILIRSFAFQPVSIQSKSRSFQGATATLSKGANGATVWTITMAALSTKRLSEIFSICI